MFDYLGGGGGGFNNQTGSLLVHIYSLIYINLHTIWNQSDNVFSKLPKYENKNSSTLWWTLKSNPGVPKCPQMY